MDMHEFHALPASELEEIWEMTFRQVESAWPGWRIDVFATMVAIIEHNAHGVAFGHRGYDKTGPYVVFEPDHRLDPKRRWGGMREHLIRPVLRAATPEEIYNDCVRNALERVLWKTKNIILADDDAPRLATAAQRRAIRRGARWALARTRNRAGKFQPGWRPDHSPAGTFPYRAKAVLIRREPDAVTA